MKNTKYLIIAVATLIAFTVAGTYAFFQALGGSTSTKNINVETHTSDLFTLTVSDEILLTASQSDFYLNAGDKSATTEAQAKLVPNNKTHTASDTYNVYVVIDTNNFVYTTQNRTPEIVLSITDPNGNTQGNIVGLNTVTPGVFDITTRTGAFKVAEDYVITTNSASGTTQNWSMTITLKNLDSDQNDNTGKSLSGTIYITKENLETYSLAELNTIRTTRTNESTGEEESSIGSTSMTVEAVTTSGSEGINTYYFGIEEETNQTGYINLANQIINGIEFYESNEPSYTFTNLKDNTNYKVYSFVEDRAGFKSNIYETSLKTSVYVLPSITNVETEVLDLHRIKVTATSAAGENQASKYYFDCGDGNGWSIGQTSNEYTCSNLTYNTNYNIKVKVEDTYGRYSVEYVKPSEIVAYQVTYTCTNCTSSNSSEYILANGTSTSDITPAENHNLENATVSGCTLTNGVATVTNPSSDVECIITAASNAKSCNAGYYLDGSSGNCTICPAGSYCPGGDYDLDGNDHGKNLCANGSYSTSTGSTSCTACAGGRTNTGTGNTSACTSACSNNTGVQTWKTPTWNNNNTVSNLCSANTCSTNYEVSGTSCVSSCYVYCSGTSGSGCVSLQPSLGVGSGFWGKFKCTNGKTGSMLGCYYNNGDSYNNNFMLCDSTYPCTAARSNTNKVASTCGGSYIYWYPPGYSSSYTCSCN